MCDALTVAPLKLGWTLTTLVPWFGFVQLQGRSRLFSGLLITFHPHALMFRISELAILEMTFW